VGFYDNSRFFRVISVRFAQFGIAGDPVIAKIWQNERFPDDPVKDSNVWKGKIQPLAYVLLLRVRPSEVCSDRWTPNRPSCGLVG
jgi:hypothetical protein